MLGMEPNEEGGKAWDLRAISIGDFELILIRFNARFPPALPCSFWYFSHEFMQRKIVSVINKCATDAVKDARSTS